MGLLFVLVILAIVMMMTLISFTDYGRIQKMIALLFWLSATKCSNLLNNNLLNYAASYFSNSFQ